MGASWILLGVLYVDLASLRAAWWLGVLATVAAAALWYAEEHGVLGGDEFTLSVVGIVSVIAAVVVCGVVAVVTDLSVQTVVSVTLAGIGVGLLGYRVVYGAVLPVPERRLERARDQHV